MKHIRSILNSTKHRVNFESFNFGYLSTDDQLKGNDKWVPGWRISLFFIHLG